MVSSSLSCVSTVMANASSVRQASSCGASVSQGGMSEGIRLGSAFTGGWDSSISGNGCSELRAMVSRPQGGRGLRGEVSMKNHATTGIFAPLVRVTRGIIGTKDFNQLRGKGIALHSQVITEFCKSIGAGTKQRQGLIRLAKKNGEKLGFLA
eukprot:TRINITY_DN1555_c0_g1_i1.p1 TRINITY_DN1555_c0_g1~~TRINITY_DN1555_c0_g1_i1.p1  ORF type:complete len:152 (-),score=19.39 TRINITY_DN1555_c0_g1_i1:315-770(-)